MTGNDYKTYYKIINLFTNIYFNINFIIKDARYTLSLCHGAWFVKTLIMQCFRFIVTTDNCYKVYYKILYLFTNIYLYKIFKI
jgi:hypothetical protein